MKKRWSLVWAGLFALGLSCATVHGQEQLGVAGAGGIMGPGPGAGRMLPMLLQAANLTAEQKRRVQKVNATHRQTFQELLSQLTAAHKEMADKLFAPGEVRARDLTPQMQRILALRSQLIQEGINVVLEIRRVLTPEQLERVSQVRERMETLQDEMRSLVEENP